MLLALTEPGPTGLLLLIFGVLMTLCAIFGRVADRFGIPIVLIFLALGMIGGSSGLGGIEFTSAGFAFRIGAIALALILFDGGINTSVSSIRRAAAPAGLLATVGVVVTAGIVAVVGRLLGLSWPTALLIGVIVSPTDVAAVLSVLGGALHLDERVASTLELESCVNDPMAVILTITVVEAISGAGGSLALSLAMVPVEFLLGIVAGVVVGGGVRLLLSKIRLGPAGLYPVVTLGAALGAFGAGTVIHGSGFLAVFVAGVMLGNGPLPYKAGLRRIHDALAWLSQVALFLMLGLLVFPTGLLPVAWVGVLLALALALVARPVAAAVCLLPLGRSLRETTYVGWVGLRGAVPILLATFPVMEGLANRNEIFHVVFFIVVFSALVQGVTIRPLTKWLRMGEVDPNPVDAALELHAMRMTDKDLRLFIIDEAVAASGARLAELPFPQSAAVVLIVRGQQPLAARGDTRLEPGDHVYVVCRPADEPTIGLFLGRSVSR